MTISNIQELKDFILNNELSINKINQLLQNTLKVILIDEGKSKKEIIILIEEYWNEYKGIKEHPLFIDADIGKAYNMPPLKNKKGIKIIPDIGNRK